jgi:hypothetical protein
MYGLWILVIIFAPITIAAFIMGALSNTMYHKYRNDTMYSYQYMAGHWSTDHYTGSDYDKRHIKEEDIPKYEKAYKRMKRWDKLNDNYFIFYIIGTIACIVTVILLFCAIFNPICAAQEVAYWSEFVPMVENLVEGSNGYQDVGITSKVIDYNSWLARARSSQEIYGNWSSYYGIDLSQLEYIKLGGQ